MKIGIIGAGNVGTGVGKRLVAAGHQVMIGFARSVEKVDEAARLIKGSAGSVEEVCAFGDVVVIATPWQATLAALQSVSTILAGKVIWDTTNAMNADLSALVVGHTSSAGEEIAAVLPNAKVVKAVVPFAEILHSDNMKINSHDIGVFVCGDESIARTQVCTLVRDIGAEPINAGPLALARYTEPLGMLLVQLAYVQGFGSRVGAALLRE
jgi:8-hydroxy-5-deazaflavin:NADPH oxidoreductase